MTTMGVRAVMVGVVLLVLAGCAEEDGGAPAKTEGSALPVLAECGRPFSCSGDKAPNQPIVLTRHETRAEPGRCVVLGLGGDPKKATSFGAGGEGLLYGAAAAWTRVSTALVLQSGATTLTCIPDPAPVEEKPVGKTTSSGKPFGIGSSCKGKPNSCSSRTAGSGSCILGCYGSWGSYNTTSDDECLGEPEPCAEITVERQCAWITGCKWE